MPITRSIDLVKNESYVLVSSSQEAMEVIFSGKSDQTDTLIFCRPTGEPFFLTGPLESSSDYNCYTCYCEADADKEFLFDKNFLLNPSSSLDDLLGLEFSAVKKAHDEILFTVKNKPVVFKLSHHQECCESIYIEDIVGDLSDLVNSPILDAKEVYSYNKDVGPAYFYDIRTQKGSVTIRFMHEDDSNWMYSAKATLSTITVK